MLIKMFTQYKTQNTYTVKKIMEFLMGENVKMKTVYSSTVSFSE